MHCFSSRTATGCRFCKVMWKQKKKSKLLSNSYKVVRWGKHSCRVGLWELNSAKSQMACRTIFTSEEEEPGREQNGDKRRNQHIQSLHTEEVGGQHFLKRGTWEMGPFWLKHQEEKSIFRCVFAKVGDVTGAEWAVIVHRCHTNNILPFKIRKMHRAISQLFCSLWAWEPQPAPSSQHTDKPVGQTTATSRPPSSYFHRSKQLDIFF